MPSLLGSDSEKHDLPLGHFLLSFLKFQLPSYSKAESGQAALSFPKLLVAVAILSPLVVAASVTNTDDALPYFLASTLLSDFHFEREEA